MISKEKREMFTLKSNRADGKAVRLGGESIEGMYWGTQKPQWESRQKKHAG